MNTGITIMIVEDNSVNLSLVSDLLEFDGFDVSRCTGAEAALERLKEIRPELILMDIPAPGLDVIELAKIVKSNHKTKTIKIVGLSALSITDDGEGILEAGYDGCITKPIDTGKFTKQVMQFLY
jgi:CheY-like chemotaxis protein